MTDLKTAFRVALFGRQSRPAPDADNPAPQAAPPAATGGPSVLKIAAGVYLGLVAFAFTLPLLSAFLTGFTHGAFP